MKFLWLILRCFAWALLTAVVFLLLFQDRLMYLPRAYAKTELADILQRHGRRIEAITSQGRQVAFYLPPSQNPSQPPAFLWLVFGGNGSLALDYLPETREWDPRFGYLFIDYPGYGLCEGHPNPERIEESMAQLTRELQIDLQWDAGEFQERTGVLGHSLGCAAALIAADRLQLHRALLCAPFSTMTEMAKRTVGWPLCFLNRHCYDNVTHLRRVEERGAQVRLFHGKDDAVIPVTMSRELAAAFPKDVRLTEVPDCGHGEIVTAASQAIGKAMLELANLPVR